MHTYGQRGSQAVPVSHLSQQRIASVSSFGSTVRLCFFSSSAAASPQAVSTRSGKQIKSDEQNQEHAQGNLDRFTPLVEVTKAPFATESKVPVAAFMADELVSTFR